jgi:hypothetical protein
VGSRHPDRVGGLIYLDAAYAYAFNNGPLVLPPNTQNLPALREMRAFLKDLDNPFLQK